MSNTLRQWQQDAHDDARAEFITKMKSLYVIEACTGSGKTYCAAQIAKTLLNEGEIDKVVVVCPSTEIKNGWQRTLDSVGFISTTESFDVPDVNALVATYQGINGDILTTGRTLLIADEFHHAERQADWGDKLSSRHATAKYTLCLSGTPWITKGRIALLDQHGYYKDDGCVKPDYAYKYRTDLMSDNEDRGTVAVRFEFLSSLATEAQGDGGKIVEFKAPNESIQGQGKTDIGDRKCQIPLGPHVGISDSEISNNKMARNMLNYGITQLDIKKEESKHRGLGLIVCRNIREARHVHDYMSIGLECRSELITSDDQQSSDRLSTISRHDCKDRPDWIVSVGMVAEGVDIPEIKVVVYLTSILTLLFLIQVIGRALRRIKRNADTYLDKTVQDTEAVIIMPAHPMLIWLGVEIENEIKKAAEAKPKDTDGEGEAGENKEWVNDGGDEKGTVTRGESIPHHLARKLDVLAQDLDTKELIDGYFRGWVSSMFKKGLGDAVTQQVDQLIATYDIQLMPEASFEKELTYDQRTKLFKAEAKNVTARIKFSHPRFRDNQSGKVYSEIRKYVTQVCFGRWVPFDKLSLNEKQQWMEAGERVYQEGLGHV